jgi:membrane protein required for colicin V production
MFLLYVGFSFVSFAAARILRDVIEKARFDAFDRHLGATFGLLKGAAFCIVLTFFVGTISESQRPVIFNSYSGYASALVMDRLHPVMPAELHEVLEPYIHTLDRPGMGLHSHAGNDDDDHHEHDGHDHDDLPSAGGDDPFTEDGTASGSVSDPLVQFVNGIEDLLDRDLRTLVLEALENTNPDDRQELMAKLSAATPEVIRTIAQSWRDGKPAGGGAGTAAGGSNTARQRDQLQREIAAIFFDARDAQQLMIQEMERALTGVPDEVSLAVLEDWHADLMALRPDPDPQTDLTSSLDVRILRQLTAARVPWSSLTSSLQNRLREAAQR